MFLFSLQFLSKSFLILRRTDTYYNNVHRPSRKAPAVLSDFNQTLTCSTYFRNTTKYLTSRKSVQRKPSFSILTDRHDEGKSRFFSIFSNARKSVPFNNYYTVNIRKINIYFKKQKPIQKNWTQQNTPKFQIKISMITAAACKTLSILLIC
jgi:hypothetical protein